MSLREQDDGQVVLPKLVRIAPFMPWCHSSYATAWKFGIFSQIRDPTLPSFKAVCNSVVHRIMICFVVHRIMITRIMFWTHLCFQVLQLIPFSSSFYSLASPSIPWQAQFKWRSHRAKLLPGGIDSVRGKMNYCMFSNWANLVWGWEYNYELPVFAWLLRRLIIKGRVKVVRGVLMTHLCILMNVALFEV